MNQKLKKTILLVDYENIQNVDISVVQPQDIEIKIFVGQSQNKIPIELVQATQRFGQKVEWIKIEGTGSNSLDFYIAYYLGQFSNKLENSMFIILSKDKGFDPLLKYINKQGIQCKRIQNLVEISKEQNTFISQNADLSSVESSKEKTTLSSQNLDLMAKIIKNLSTVHKNKRPKTRITLRHHIKSLLSKNKINDQDTDKIINMLLIQNKITEVSSNITYNF